MPFWAAFGEGIDVRLYHGCERCNGLVIPTSFAGGEDARTAWEYQDWKCLNCGYVTDLLAEKNRTVQTREASIRLLTRKQPSPVGSVSRHAA